MKKIALAVVGLSALLASCDTAVVTPDGSARMVGIETEYYTGAATSTPRNYVGCDEVTGGTDIARKNSTQVVVIFAASGTINGMVARLRGVNDDAINTNFQKTLTATEIANLKKDANGNYRLIFDANSATGALLPASIIVNPNPTELPEKAVTASNKVSGGFYAELVVTFPSGTATISTKNIDVIDVYRTCALNTVTPLNN